ncbi:MULTISPECIES: hypothetical protein [unclassified Pseudomonas]|uniref:hypothetical protein n=1 Tax=unclassified Pseudomonas TaxID=196821 RepID=UPI001CC0E4AE|nr:MULTISPECIES: hypothetical protein [unclassified Pseudomonas]
MANIEKHSPELASALKKGFSSAKSQLADAIALLDVEMLRDEDKKHVESFFGEVTAYDYQSMVEAYKAAYLYIDNHL